LSTLRLLQKQRSINGRRIPNAPAEGPLHEDAANHLPSNKTESLFPNKRPGRNRDIESDEKSVEVTLRPITLDEISSLCREIVLERAREYVADKKVDEVSISENTAKAIVHGTEDYDVLVEIGPRKHEIKATCTCPYSKAGQCKHIIAVLLKLAKQTRSIGTQPTRRKANIEQILNKASKAELREILKEELGDNDELRDRLLIRYGKGGKSIGEYKRMVDHAYMNAGDREGYLKWDAFVDFTKIEERAELHAARGDFAEALKAYKAMTEVIDEWQNNVDDSSGHHADAFERALAKMLECINAMKLDRDGLFEELDYLASRSVEAEMDYFGSEYWDALMILCVSQETLERVVEHIQPYVPDTVPREDEEGHYAASTMVEQYLQALERLADFDREKWQDPLYEQLNKHATKDFAVLTLFVQRLVKDKRLDDAIHIAEQGLQFFHGLHQIDQLHATLLQLRITKNPPTRPPKTVQQPLDQST
jgi:tetratricopeptide (TPR) repeat protein